MARCDLRILNLETAITTSDQAMPDKTIHYRMNPANVGVLSAAAPDACVLANNHVLDFGESGLLQTLQALTAAGLETVGVGRDDDEAWRPLEFSAGGRRVLLWSVGAADSGVPASWTATPGRPGVAFVGDLSEAVQADLCARIERTKRPGDLAVVSVHWGSNWGYRIPRAHVRFARRLVDAGADGTLGLQWES